MNILGKRMVVIGGTAGIGHAVASLGAAYGATVTVASRSRKKVNDAVQSISGNVSGRVLDMTCESSVQAFFGAMREIDYLIVTASAVTRGGIATLPLSDALAMMQSKFWGPYLCAKYAQVVPDGSITLFSGVLSRRPGSSDAALSAVNSAVEGLGRALALELAPVRVNTVSPGLTSGTDAFAALTEEAKHTMFDAVARNLPVGRVGTPFDIASATLSLATNPFMTGIVLDVDGGYLLS